jgi:dipeptidase D
MTDKVLAELEPSIVWNIFEQITRVPRPSKKEEKIRAWIKQWAKKNDIKVAKEDKTGNILLTKEASKGFEDVPTLILQAHMDMVCQKLPKVEINFETDSIPIKIEGNKVLAEGTTLGADNGIGMAYGLAALISTLGNF